MSIDEDALERYRADQEPRKERTERGFGESPRPCFPCPREEAADTNETGKMSGALAVKPSS